MEEWVTESDSDDSKERRKKDGISVPSHYKKYTVEDRKIVMQLPDRQNEKNKSYDGPKDAKKIDIAEPGEESRPMYIATDLTSEEESELIKLLKEFRDVFAWSFKDLKGVDPAVCQHTIPMREDAKPSKQRPYSYNENFAAKIKEEIDKLKEAGFIYEIEHTEWVSPIVVVPKKNGKL